MVYVWAKEFSFEAGEFCLVRSTVYKCLFKMKFIHNKPNTTHQPLNKSILPVCKPSFSTMIHYDGTPVLIYRIKHFWSLQMLASSQRSKFSLMYLLYVSQ